MDDKSTDMHLTPLYLHVTFQVDNSSHSVLTRVMEDFQTEGRLVNDLYTIHCCKGLALELLSRLSTDLNFQYDLSHCLYLNLAHIYWYW